jgi:hypothetical protein
MEKSRIRDPDKHPGSATLITMDKEQLECCNLASFFSYQHLSDKQTPFGVSVSQ